MTSDDLAAAPIVELVACAPGAEAGRALGEMAFRADAWSPGETAMLRDLFAQDLALDQIAIRLHRPLAGVADRIYALGLRRHSMRSWSDLEDAMLCKGYGTEAAATIAARLGRSCTAVYARAAMLGLTEPNPPKWTAWEDAQLVEAYARGLAIDAIATLIGRRAGGVASRASTLGLKHPNHPPGWSEAETCRALELVETGLRYTAAIEQLVREGFPRRSKAAFNPKLRALGYGRGWGRAWTPEEDALLTHVYVQGTSLTPLRTRLARTQHSIRWRAAYLGLAGTHCQRNGFRGGPDWTPDDLALLRREYGKTPSAVLAEKLGRTKAAMFTRANLLGLVHGYIKAWTPDDIEALRLAFAHGIAIADLARALDRKAIAVSKYATKHGLDFGRRKRSPEHLTAADILALGTANPANCAAAPSA